MTLWLIKAESIVQLHNPPSHRAKRDNTCKAKTWSPSQYFCTFQSFAASAETSDTDAELACRVKHLGSKGWGLIAKQHVRQGSLVLEYVGEHNLLACLAAMMCMEPHAVPLLLYAGTVCLCTSALYTVIVCLQVI